MPHDARCPQSGRARCDTIRRPGGDESARRLAHRVCDRRGQGGVGGAPPATPIARPGADASTKVQAIDTRRTTGRGQFVDVALYESVFSVMESLLPEFDAFGAVRERTGSILPGIAPTSTDSALAPHSLSATTA